MATIYENDHYKVIQPGIKGNRAKTGTPSRIVIDKQSGARVHPSAWDTLPSAVLGAAKGEK